VCEQCGFEPGPEARFGWEDMIVCDACGHDDPSWGWFKQLCARARSRFGFRRGRRLTLDGAE